MSVLYMVLTVSHISGLQSNLSKIRDNVLWFAKLALI